MIRNKKVLSGVAIPRNMSEPPTRNNTFGIPNSCLTIVFEKSASFEPLVTRIPVARDIKRDGIDDERPSPMVRMV